MTVYVYRGGRLVPKGWGREKRAASSFPSPKVSRMDPYESPVTGKEIRSWRERDADMKAADAFDPRDLPKDHVHARGRSVPYKEEITDASAFKWRDPPKRAG